MKVGKKLFPYPTLNNYKLNNSYNNSIYELKIGNMFENDGNLVLHDIQIQIENEDIERFLNDGRAKASLVIECSQTTFRRILPISTEPIEIKIPLAELCGTVEISSFIYATQDISDYNSSSFIEDYKDYSFQIDKFSIMAIDDGFKTTVLHEDKKDKKISSIFSVIPNIDEGQDGFIVSSDPDRIVIQIPPKSYGFYDNLKKNDNFKNMFFGIMGIPALAYCLQDIKDNFEQYSNDFTEVISDKTWFNSIMLRYKKLHDEELTPEVFAELNSFTFAQELLDYGSTKSIEDMKRVFIGEGIGDDDD